MFSDLDRLFDLNGDGELDVLEQGLEYQVVCGDLLNDEDDYLDNDSDFLDNDYDL